MTPAVCVQCCREMKIQKAGVTVVEYAEFGPYQLWQADRFECPSCGAQFITRFALEAIAAHHEAEFDRYLKNVPAENIIHCPLPARSSR